MQNSQIIDVSYWQGPINWEIVAAHKEPNIAAAAIRATVSWGYTDLNLRANWLGAKASRIPRMAYHVIYPSQPTDMQIENLKNALGDDIGELPIVLDVEATSDVRQEDGSISAKYGMYQKSIMEHADAINKWTGSDPIIYSAGSYVDSYITQILTHGNWNTEWMSRYYWWLAHYGYKGTARVGAPNRPVGLSEDLVVLHQYTCTGVPIGMTEASALDYNRILKPEYFENITSKIVERPQVEHKCTIEDKVLRRRGFIPTKAEHTAK